jgi:hypothetical protein
MSGSVRRGARALVNMATIVNAFTFNENFAEVRQRPASAGRVRAPQVRR